MILRKLPRVGPCEYELTLPGRLVDSEDGGRFYAFRWPHEDPSGKPVTTMFTEEEIAKLYAEMRRLKRQKRKANVDS
jgi:hypothetical protein